MASPAANLATSLASILLSTVLFLMGNGLIGTLTPLRAHLEGFSDIAVGALGAWYYGGFLVGCIAGPPLLVRVGHIRSFAVAAAMTGVAVLIQPLWTSPSAWFGLRALAGFAIAILYMAVESWLNDRATNMTRGRILALYVAVSLAALLAGQWLLLLAPPASLALFSIGAILYCLCLMPMGLTRLPPPQTAAMPPIDLRRIFTASPVGVAGCVTVGLANGAFWSLAPLYAQALGFSTAELALFMSVFIAGGALIQWPLGRISDGADRRWIIAATCTAASFCGIVLGLLGWLLVRAPNLFYGLVFALGAAMLPLYSLSIAHANDRLPRDAFIPTSAGLLMITATASIAGPLLAGFVISAAGPYSLFLFTGLAHAAMGFYAFMRIRAHEPAPLETREAFHPAPPGSPAALPLDPRGPATQEPITQD